MTYTAIDSQSFAGAFTVGMTKAGFDVIAKREYPAGFGINTFTDNLDHFGEVAIQTADPKEWDVVEANVLFGNPPCSGFSVMSVKVGGGGKGKDKKPQFDFRGIDSPANQCMWDMMAYGARVLPEIIIMESVTAAGRRGQQLMFDLHDYVEELTGIEWEAHHVFHNNLSVGGPAMRKRFFLVLSRIPFGLGTHPLERVPTFEAITGDIETLPLKFEEQPIRRGRSRAWWADEAGVRTGDTVTGHDVMQTIKARRANALLAIDPDLWQPGEKFGPVAKRYVDEYFGGDPQALLDLDGWTQTNVNFFTGRNWEADTYQPRRWYPEKSAYVIVGDGLEVIIHPSQPRTLTVREGARIIGLPDSWDVSGFWKGAERHAIGKGIPVHSGEWIGNWAKRALDGRPGKWRGEEIRQRTWLTNTQNDFKAVYNDRTGEAGDFRSKELRREMEARPE